MASQLGGDYEGPYLRIPSAGKRINHTRPLNKLLPRVVELDLEWTHQTPTVLTMASTASHASVFYNAFSIYDPDWNRGISEYSVQGFKELGAAGYSHYFVHWVEIDFRVTGSSTSGSNQSIYMFIRNCSADDAKYEQLTLLQPMRWAESPGMLQIKKLSDNTQDMTGKMYRRFTPGFYWPAKSAIDDPNNWGTITYNSATGTSGTNPTNKYFLEVGLIADQIPGATMGFNGHVSLRYHTTVWRQDTVFPTFLDNFLVPYATWSAAEGFGEAVEVAGGPPGQIAYQEGDEGSGVLADIEPAAEWTDDA